RWLLRGPLSILSLPAASPPHAIFTQRRYSPTARCSSQEVTATALLRRARNCTIRRAGPGRPPAASAPEPVSTQRRCCPTARSSSQQDLTKTTHSAQLDCTPNHHTYRP